MTNELRPVPDLPDLLASDGGEIYRRYPDGRLRRLKQTRRRDGYHIVNAKKGGKWAPHYVHRLVASAWYGAPDGPGTVTRHLDGNRQNNDHRNLRLGSAAENVADTVKSGRMRKGAEHPNARLTLADVVAIKHALMLGVSYNVAANHWGVTKAAIADIARGRTWRDVKPLKKDAAPAPEAGDGAPLAV